MEIRRVLTALLVGGALAAGATLAAPGVAEARGNPENCHRLPYGWPGCEDHLGATVRADFAARGFPALPLSDWQVGRAVGQLCFDGHIGPDLLRDVRPWVPVLNRHKHPYCG